MPNDSDKDVWFRKVFCGEEASGLESDADPSREKTGPQLRGRLESGLCLNSELSGKSLSNSAVSKPA